MSDRQRNTWEDERIQTDPRIDSTTPAIRAAAEFIHRNESMHRHDGSGPICPYCALVATRAIAVYIKESSGLQERPAG